MIKALLWDFGDTIANERWMHTAPSDCPEWPKAWAEVMAQHADSWNIGRVSETDIFRELAEVTGLTVEQVAAHTDECCRSIVFHPHTWTVVTSRRLPQALVTVNPEVFVERVAKHYELARHFDVIVVSGVEGTDDKTVLSDIALERLGLSNQRDVGLLIDNRRDLVDAWLRVRGSAYWYRGDDDFAANPPAVLR